MPYAVAGEAMRAAVERANQVRPPLKAGARAVLDAVLVMTTSYSKVSDDVRVDELAAAAGQHERTTRRHLAALAAARVIVWQPRRGARSRSLVAIAETGQLGEAKPGVVTPAQTGSQDARLKAGGVTPAPNREGGPEEFSEEDHPTDWLMEVIG